MKNIILLLVFSLPITYLFSVDYHVGPEQSLTTISEVPWATLEAGDRVYIHWKSTPYHEKWVINRQGTELERIEIIGVNGINGEQPVIDGNGAVTPLNLDYWNEDRSVIKIGGSSFPENGLPSFITIENLEIRSAHPDYQYTDDNGNTGTYTNNAAAIFVEKAQNLIIRNCTLHNSGNGLFISSSNGLTENILIENNYIYGNGIVGDAFEHNTYTSAINITYQYNRFGPLREGADGNNLKDRSAGLVVKYNWIEGGNRQLDLVDADGTQELLDHPDYQTTFVYGNILIEPEDEGNSQIVHYGGDSGSTESYRKGTLYFYNNTIISNREGFTTLLRLSSNDESAELFNNVIYTIASGNNFAVINDAGTVNMNNNWLKDGWVECHCIPTGIVNELENNITGSDPLFENIDDQEYRPQMISSLVNGGGIIPLTIISNNDLLYEYVKHQNSNDRFVVSDLDIGAFESMEPVSIETNNKVSVNIYPNPSEDHLIIENNNGFYFSYEIINSSSQVSLIGKLDKTNRINISNLSEGNYFIRLNNNEQSTLLQFIKL